MPESSDRHCEHCGAPIPPRRRSCLACLTPVHGPSHEGQIAGIAREIPTTHRPDRTLVDVPEHREARLRRARRNRRILIAALAACVVLAVAAVLFLRARKHQQAQAAGQRREQMARRELDLYARGLDLFYSDFGRYPTAREGLSSLVRQPSTLAAWRGPYVESDHSVDPWGNDYVYLDINEGKDYMLYTYGPEGEAGGRPFLQAHTRPAAGASSPSPEPRRP